MKWKKFKKERISLDYTVMLVPHSKKKPIHFKTPVWTFGLCFLFLLVLTGTCLFFAGSNHQLKQVQREKEQLEQEWAQLAQQKQEADQENEALRLERQAQEQERQAQEMELKELERQTRDTLEELKELTERENQIRQELGLEGTTENAESFSGESVSQIQDGGVIPAAEGRVLQVNAARLSTAMNTGSSLELVRKEINFLQSSLASQSSQYDGYMETIEKKKQAQAEEKARKERVRASIVRYALQFVGNAYVYGGNDPNTGVDCSGFTRYVIGHMAGIGLNRTAASQSTQGRPVSVQEARPGDLVFYSGGGGINHVAIYMGDGRVVHASNERVGITTSDMYYRTPTKIVSVLGD